MKQNTDIEKIITKINNNPEKYVELKGSKLLKEDISEFISKIISNSKIADLNLSNLYFLKDKEAQAIAEALKFNSTLTLLDLKHNRISNEGAKAIFKALKVNATLTLLNLDSNNISDEGVQYIAQPLKFNSTLMHLDLSCNKIEDPGAQTIAEALRLNSTLTSLGLYKNNICNKGAKAIFKALKLNSTLTHLDLSCNKIEAPGAQAIAEALRLNSTLTSLALYRNNIESKGTKAIAKSLSVNSFLTFLDLRLNDIVDKEAKAISNILKVNYTIQDLLLPYSKEIIEKINDYPKLNKTCIQQLAKFIEDNLDEFSKGYAGSIEQLKVNNLSSFPKLSEALKIELQQSTNTSGVDYGVYALLKLLSKINVIAFKPLELATKLSTAIDKSKEFIAANFFKWVCKSFSTSNENDEVVNHIFAYLPKEIIMKIIYGLPLPYWKKDVDDNGPLGKLASGATNSQDHHEIEIAGYNFATDSSCILL